MRRHTISTKQDRQWQGIPTIECAANGRLWCAFFSGGPKEPDINNAILITTSDDKGVSWSPPQVIIDPPGRTRAYDPCLWHDPDGCLWLIYNQANLETREFGLWAMTAPDSGAARPTWSNPRRLAIDAPFAFRLNKPTVLMTGQWLLPVTWAKTAPHDWFAGDQQVQGVAISGDHGQTWTLHGDVEAPAWALENMIIEHKDGILRMFIRTGAGEIWQSFSFDQGRSWMPGLSTGIFNPGARFFIRRLASGRLLFINTPDQQRRQGLTAYLSDLREDTEMGIGLELDPRDKVSYPDAVQAPDGTIYAVHDCDRQGLGEIILDVFTEQDILAVRG